MEGQRAGSARKIAATPQNLLDSSIDSAKRLQYFIYFLRGKSSSVTKAHWKRIAGIVPLPPVSAQLAIKCVSENSRMIGHLLVGGNSDSRRFHQKDIVSKRRVSITAGL